MTENAGKPLILSPGDDTELTTSEVVRFYSEVGRDVVELGRMFRAPTQTRPFIYEVRLDLWPASNSGGLAILKGFGAEGGLLAFQEGSGLVAQLRGMCGRFRAGKIKFGLDKFPPANYEKRVASWQKEVEYVASKRPAR